MVDIVRPSELDPAATVVANDALLIDTGLALQKVTAAQIVDGGRPNASEAEALEGADNFKRMSPLRVKQAIDGSDIAINAAAALAAAEAGIAGAYAHRAAFEGDNLPVPVIAWSVMTNGIKHDFVRDDAGTAIESANGVKGSPAGQPLVSHWGELGTADDVAVFNLALASGFKSIEVPPGTFTVAANIQVFGDDTRLFSRGGTTIKAADNAPANFSLLRIRGARCVIEGITWDGNLDALPVGGSGNVGFVNLDTTGDTIADVTIIGNTIKNISGYGIFSFNAGTLSGVSILGNTFLNFVSAAPTAPGAISLVQPTLSKVLVQFNIFNGLTGACMNARSVNGTVPTYDVVFANNYCRSGTAVYATLGCEIWNVRNATVTGNTFTETRIGVSVSGDDVAITGNTFRDMGSYGIEAHGDGYSITGNTMVDFQYGIIVYRGASVFSICGNTFRNAKATATYGSNLGWSIQLSASAAYAGFFEDFTISGNTSYDTSGMQLNYLVRGSITGNSFTGVSLDHPGVLRCAHNSNSDVLIQGNKLTTLVDYGASTGAMIVGGAKGSVKGNRIVNAHTSVNSGIGIANAGGVVMTDWDIDENTIDGFTTGIDLVNGSTAGYARLLLGGGNQIINCTLALDIPSGSGNVFRRANGGYTAWADADATLDGESRKINLFGTLAANRTLTLPTTNVYNGQTFHITRGGGGVGTLAVGGIKTLNPGTWCEVAYTGSTWIVISYGSLS